MQLWICGKCGFVVSEYEHDMLEEEGYQCPKCGNDTWDRGYWENATTF